MEKFDSYDVFKEKTSYQKRELSLGDGDFIPCKEKVFPKIGDNREYLPFFGDTVIFDLDDNIKELMARFRDAIYAEFGDCLAEILPTDTLHMTLHDLSAGEDLSDVAPLCFDNEIKLLDVKKQYGFPREKIRVQTKFIVNMVSTSLVMTLAPENGSEEEWNKLETLYRRIDKVRECPYPHLTPHITLAYFRREPIDAQTARRLEKLVYELNGMEPVTVVLDTEKLYYKVFTSMRDYRSVFCLCD